jgi:flagellar motor protein MotB
MSKFIYHSDDSSELHTGQDGEASYFASATDLLVGFLFIFIILIALSRTGLEIAGQEHSVKLEELSEKIQQTSEKAEQLAQRVAALNDTSETRNHILQLIENGMRQNIAADPTLPQVTIDLNAELGTIRLGDEQLDSGLFPKRGHVLSGAAERLIRILGATLESILPCFAYHDPAYRLSTSDRRILAHCERLTKTTEARELHGKLAAVLIEGHTDIDKMQGQIRIDSVGDSHSTNFALSTRRASSAYNVMMGLQQDEDLDDYQSNQPPLSDRLLFNLIAPAVIGANGTAALPKRLLAVSGYGQFSPLVHCEENRDEQAQETCNKRNRRIELRFVMATPEPADSVDVVPATAQ